MNLIRRTLILAAALLICTSASVPLVLAAQPQNPQNGSIGLEGQVNGGPPSQGATITVPGNGQSFSTTPITVAGICPTGLLVEIFKNNVFGGSTECTNGSFSLQVDLFAGRNDLVSRVFDALNQPGPDSSIITVIYSANITNIAPQLLVTTEYAKRGALPGNTLSWPITISGGIGPYALSVDWGDKTNADLISRVAAGSFDIDHVYARAGVYNVTIRVTDSKGSAAFLQVVGIGNGPIQQTAGKSTSPQVIIQNKLIWWPLIVALVLIFVAFWLGRKQQIETIKKRLRRGQRPF